jgi:hypothetical protein
LRASVQHVAGAGEVLPRFQAALAHAAAQFLVDEDVVVKGLQKSLLVDAVLARLVPVVDLQADEGAEDQDGQLDDDDKPVLAGDGCG